jgi:dienelactone hydrolase
MNKKRGSNPTNRPGSSQTAPAVHPRSKTFYLIAIVFVLAVFGIGIVIGSLKSGADNSPKQTPSHSATAQNQVSSTSKAPAPGGAAGISNKEFRGQSGNSGENPMMPPLPAPPGGKPMPIPDERGQFEPKDVTWPCQVNDVCPQDSICNVISGRCVYMGTGESESPVVFAIFPPSLAPGDILLVDGDGLYFEALDNSRVWKDGRWQLAEEVVVLSTVSIGGKQVPASFLGEPDECRLMLRVPPGFSGPVSVSLSPPDGQIYTATSTEVLVPNRKLGDTLDCSLPNVPKASSQIPQNPHMLGPYASGYLDTKIKDDDVRVHYPAKCAGLRAPVSDGKFPMIAILHGKGSIYLNYEYLGRHLASWGYIVVSQDSSEVPVIQATLMKSLTQFNQALPSLANHLKGNKIILVGHSRGAMRATLLQDSPLNAHISGIAMLGPFNVNALSQHPLLIISASEDQQASPQAIKAYFNRQEGDSWHFGLVGGNHGQFTDRRHWSRVAGLDGAPLMPRALQHDLVRGIVLAFAQRIHGPTEYFSNIMRGQDLPGFLYYEKR